MTTTTHSTAAATPWATVVRGVAFGDAWGNPNEFRSIRDLTRDEPCGPYLPKELEVTDDTQMTLYLGDALDASWDQPQDMVKREIIANYLTYRTDPDNNRAPGVTVMTSLGNLADGQRWQDATSRYSDGSGTVMRTSPCAFLPKERWVGVTAFAAAVTHGTANGIAAAILNVAVLRDILAGKVKAGGLLSRARELCRDPARAGLLDVGTWLEDFPVDLAEGFAELNRLIVRPLVALDRLQADPWLQDYDPSLQIGTPLKGGGWRAHETLVIALLAIDMIPDAPWLALQRAVTTDGDSDTIGAVAGGLLGALDPAVIQRAWNVYRTRFEPRYVRWIETEADHYAFAAPLRRGLAQRLLRRT